MRTWIIAILATASIALAACGGPAEIEGPIRNADGRTYFCDDCQEDVPWPESGHVHGLTSYCSTCKVRVAAEGHVHREDRWCDECAVVATFVDEDATADWEARGHFHGQTAWCDRCKIDVSRKGPGEAGGHHHSYTAFCADAACGIDVTRRWTSDGANPTDPPELVADHVHGKTTYCPMCRTEVERDEATGRPSRNHFHHLTRYNAESKAEVGVVGHQPGVTAFCQVCLAEVPLSPGVPTGSLSGDHRTLKSDPAVMGADAHQKASDELAAQETLAKSLKDALAATEAKLGIEEQPLVHDHSHPYAWTGGNEEILGADPVSRLRNYDVGEGKESVETEVAKRVDDTHKARYLPRADVIRNAVDRLRAEASLTEDQEAELRFWEDLEKKLENGGGQ